MITWPWLRDILAGSPIQMLIEERQHITSEIYAIKKRELEKFIRECGYEEGEKVELVIYAVEVELDALTLWKRLGDGLKDQNGWTTEELRAQIDEPPF